MSKKPKKLKKRQLLKTKREFRQAFRQAIADRKFVDTHVHDMPLCMGQYAKQGLEEATAYHYCMGEAASKAKLTRTQQAELSKKPVSERADFVVEQLGGQDELGVSTAVSGLFSMAHALGLDTDRSLKKVLRDWRKKYGKMPAEEYRDMVFDMSCIERMVSTQSIFQPGEAKLYCNPSVMQNWDPRYDIGMRVDELLRNQKLVQASAKIAGFENAAGEPKSRSTQSACNELLSSYVDRFSEVAQVHYLSASLGPKDRFYTENGRPSGSRFALIMRKVILETARQHSLPVFLMPYVTRGLNPSGAETGDIVAHGDLGDLERFVSENDDVRFIITGLHPNMNYDLCFLTRCCPNVRMIGYWWGNLNSHQIRSQSQERLEFIGWEWTWQNSDSRITDQILYKWPDFFTDFEEVLVETHLPSLRKKRVPITPISIQNGIDRLSSLDCLLGY